MSNAQIEACRSVLRLQVRRELKFLQRLIQHVVLKKHYAEIIVSDGVVADLIDKDRIANLRDRLVCFEPAVRLNWQVDGLEVGRAHRDEMSRLRFEIFAATGWGPGKEYELDSVIAWVRGAKIAQIDLLDSSFCHEILQSFDVLSPVEIGIDQYQVSPTRSHKLVKICKVTGEHAQRRKEIPEHKPAETGSKKSRAAEPNGDNAAGKNDQERIDGQQMAQSDIEVAS